MSSKPETENSPLDLSCASDPKAEPQGGAGPGSTWGAGPGPLAPGCRHHLQLHEAQGLLPGASQELPALPIRGQGSAAAEDNTALGRHGRRRGQKGPRLLTGLSAISQALLACGGSSEPSTRAASGRKGWGCGSLRRKATCHPRMRWEPVASRSGRLEPSLPAHPWTSRDHTVTCLCVPALSSLLQP